jgi:hypothetical protein
MIKAVRYNGTIFYDYSWDYQKKAVVGRNGRYLQPNKLNYGSIVKLKQNGTLYTVIIEKLSEEMDKL